MKYLITGPAWIGDMVMAQTLFILLKQHDPNAVIDVLAPGWSQPLLQRMPEVNQGIELSVGHGELALGKRYALGRKLAEHGYDQAIVLPNSFKSALVSFWAKIKQRTGWRGECRYGLLNDIRVLDKSRYPLMTERFAALALPKDHPLPTVLPAPSLLTSADQQTQALKQFKLDKQRPVLGLCPGAEFGPAKRWPEKYYAHVATHYIEQGWQVWMMGSLKDAPVAAQIKAHIPGKMRSYAHSFAGKTALAQAIDLLSLTDVVITNDSGLMHICAALKKNLVAIYGSSSPLFTPPLNDNKIILSLNLECSPCFKRECPLGHLNCLRKLLPDQVIDAVNQFM